MTLIKTSLLNSIAVIVRMLTLLGINKVLALYVGPAGYAAVGQFQNAVQMITTFASGAINTGVTKYTAEYYNDEKKQLVVWRTSGTITIIGSIIVSVFIAIFHESLAIWFLKDSSYGDVFLWFAATLVLFTFNTLLLAILNGKKAIKHYVAASTFGSIFSLFFTLIMVVTYGLYGALVALAIYQSVSFFITLLICYKNSWFKIGYLFGGVDKETVLNLAKFSAMALVSAICVPLTQILIRDGIITKLGVDAAGLYEGMWRLSAAYLIFVTSTLGVYFLPRFSEIKNYPGIKQEVLKSYKLLIPLLVASLLFIFIFKEKIIEYLFSSEFSQMQELFIWQLTGDFFKACSWLIAYIMLSKTMTTIYIMTEIIFNVLFLMLSYFLLDLYGFSGAAIAHSIVYVTYWAVLLILIPKKLKSNQVIQK